MCFTIAGYVEAPPVHVLMILRSFNVGCKISGKQECKRGKENLGNSQKSKAYDGFSSLG